MKDIKVEKMDLDIKPVIKQEKIDQGITSTIKQEKIDIDIKPVIKQEDIKPVIKREKIDKDIKPVIKREKADTHVNDDVKLKCQNCPICLANFDSNSILSSPDVCQHVFCLECLQEWSKKVNTCPIDRRVYTQIHVKNIFNKTLRKIKVEDRTQQHREEYEQDLTFCEVCRQANREDRMLLCDACDRGYHCECLNPVIDDIPEGEWFCPECVRMGRGRNYEPTTSRNTNQVRVIARTNFAEQVRRNVNENRRTRSVLNEIENRTIVRKTFKRKTYKRKRVKRIRRKVTRKKSAIKKEPGIKTEPGTITKQKRKVKRRRRVKRVSKKTKTNLLKLNVLNIKKKYKLSNRTPKERILKRIINEHEKKINDSVPSSEKLSNTYNGFRTVDDEDCAAVQLTSQTSDYFQDLKDTKPIDSKPCTSSSLDLLDSIMSSQKVLSQNSSKIKLNHNGKIELVKKPSLGVPKQDPIKRESSLIKNEPKRVKVEPVGNEKRDQDSTKKHSQLPNETRNIKDLKASLGKKESKAHLDVRIKSEPLEVKQVKMEPQEKIPKQDSVKFKSEPQSYENQPNTSKFFNETNKPSLVKFKSEPLEHLKEKNLNKSKSFDVEQKSDSIQDQIALVCKNTIKPFFVDRTIDKDEYKMIMKKVVTKVRAHVKDLSMLNNKKVSELALAYVEKIKFEKKNSVQIKTEKIEPNKIKQEIDKLFDD